MQVRYQAALRPDDKRRIIGVWVGAVNSGMPVDAAFFTKLAFLARMRAVMPAMAAFP